MKIEAILFDFGGTLDNDGIDWFSRIYHRVAERTGELEKEWFHALADQAANDITLLEDTTELDMDETVYRLCDYIHANMKEDGQSAQQWNPREVADDFIAEARTFLRRNQQILSQLQQRFRLGCISNNWGNTKGWCRGYQLDQFFETMIDSTVVGSVKPDGVIFQAALDEMKLPAEACVYVGDRYDCDVLGAHAAGLIPVWITNGQHHGPDDLDLTAEESAPDPLRRIAKLSDLLEIDW